MVAPVLTYCLPPTGADFDVTVTGGNDKGQLTGRPSLHASMSVAVHWVRVEDSATREASCSNFSRRWVTVDLRQLNSCRLEMRDSSAEILLVNDFFASLLNPRLLSPSFHSRIFYLDSLIYLTSSVGFLPLLFLLSATLDSSTAIVVF